MPRPSQRPYLRPWPRWIALWAFALAALAPTVSRTLALAGQPGWVEVCTAAGVRWLRLADGAAAGEPAAPTDAAPLDHCPLCVLMGERLGPASSAFTLAPVPAVHGRPADVRLPLAPHRFAIAAAARGPPAAIASSVA